MRKLKDVNKAILKAVRNLKVTSTNSRSLNKLANRIIATANGKKPNPETLHRWAKSMRKKPTKAEKAFHDAIVRAELMTEFSWQAVRSGYILDFLHKPSNYAVEIDGPIHDRNKAWDDLRTDTLWIECKIKVLRLYNADVLADPDHALGEIMRVIRPHPPEEVTMIDIAMGRALGR